MCQDPCLFPRILLSHGMKTLTYSYFFRKKNLVKTVTVGKANMEKNMAKNCERNRERMKKRPSYGTKADQWQILPNQQPGKRPARHASIQQMRLFSGSTLNLRKCNGNNFDILLLHGPTTRRYFRGDKNEKKSKRDILLLLRN